MKSSHHSRASAGAHPPASERRLAVFVDDAYVPVEVEGEQRLATDRPFMLFAAAVAEHFDGLTVFGRRASDRPPVDHLLPAGTDFVALPDYGSLLEIRRFAAALPAAARRMWRGLDGCDVIWIFGPHPLALLLALQALVKRKRVVLGVRQDSVAYFRSRLSGSAGTAAALALDTAFRLLARRLPVTVVGEALAARYGGGHVLAMTVSLVRDRDLAEPLPVRDFTGRIRLLTVGRIDREKEPLLLVRLMSLLLADEPGRYELTVVGTGPLADELQAEAQRAGVADSIELTGYIPFGPQLFEQYRSAHVFVHVALTEGVPQVLLEAFAAGTAVVATDVGGVAGATAGGEAALLVRPRDGDALRAAVTTLVHDERRRDRVVARGRELVERVSLEREAERVARFVAGDHDR
jgi:glycosyltransferase involved in cell wall biosynthesis